MNQKKKRIRPLSRDYLIRATYRYLERFATTEKNLRDVLERKVRRILSQQEKEQDEESFKTAMIWIEEIVTKCRDQNLVNDTNYAQARARSLLRSGNSTRMVAQKLRAKGVEVDLIKIVLENYQQENPDMDYLAAIRYAKRRRFGAFSSRHDGSVVMEKEVASMCRAGFSYEMAQKILKQDKAALEDKIYEQG